MLRQLLIFFIVPSFMFNVFANESEQENQVKSKNCSELFFGYKTLEAEYVTEAKVKNKELLQEDANAETFPEKPEDIDYDWIKNHSDKFLVFYNWMTAADRRGVFYDSLISERTYQAASEQGLHESEIYGFDTVRDLKRMVRYLDQLPVGEEFELSVDIIREAHKKGSQSEKKWQQRLVDASMGLLKGYVFQPGEFKKRRNQLSLSAGVTHKQYKSLQGKLDHLIELGVFKHVNNKNRHEYELKPSKINPPYPAGRLWKGWLLYPSAKIVDQAMEDIVAWANESIQAYHRGDEGALDPVYIGVVVKQAIVYIHPFVNGNGRISKAVRDKIFEVFGIIPESRLNMYHDIDLSIEEDYKLTKLGIARRVRLLSSKPEDRPESAWLKYGLSRASDEGFSIRNGSLKVSKKTVPDRAGLEIYKIGKTREKEFIFTSSGFFQDYTGVVYTVVPHSRHEGFKLAPLADQNMVMYGFASELDPAEKVPTRSINPHHKRLVEHNLVLLNAINTAPGIARGVDIIDYEKIREANNNGEPYIYSWEKQALLDSFVIHEDPEENPQAILYPYNGLGHINGFYSTSFENHVISGATKIPYDDIIGQAMRMDIYLRKMERFVRSKHPELATEFSAIIYNSRKKIHAATRLMLKDLFPLLIALNRDFSKQNYFSSEEDWRYLKQSRLLLGMYQYLKRTHFWYEDFDQRVLEMNADTAPLMRVSSKSRMKQTGLVPEASIGRLMRKYALPLVQAAVEVKAELKRVSNDKEKFELNRLSSKLAKRLAQFVLSNGTYRSFLNTFITQILPSPYLHRGLEIEFEREFNLMTLHWANRPPKQGVSLTTRPGLIFSDYVQFNSPIKDSGLFVVDVPLDKMRVGLASGFTGEYEVTVMDPHLNLKGLRKNFILYESYHPRPLREEQKEGDDKMKFDALSEQEQITSEKAQEIGVSFGNLNYIIHDGEVSEEAQRVLENLVYKSEVTKASL